MNDVDQALQALMNLGPNQRLLAIMLAIGRTLPFESPALPTKSVAPVPGADQPAPPDGDQADAQLAAAVALPWEKFESILLTKSRVLNVGRSLFSRGIHEFKRLNPSVIETPGHPRRRDLFNAIATKSFNYSQGQIIETAPA